ncbi:MAG: D-glycero-beta-D-manno-heptose 1-phosphate adenylyltransferase [Chloroflexota bacterium]|nr:D-glycero-beta-D-manno-heptose 1-phosphate adenylyltransferase [Chloroflexota bacterium]
MTTTVELVRRFRQLRALVIGDAMLDSYLEGTATRLCSEGPVPIVRKTAERRVAGGAANTTANLRALGADVVFLGITGHDIAGTLLRSILREQGISDDWLVEDEMAATQHKLRILANGQYVVRFDEGTQHYTPETRQQLLAHLEAEFPRCDVVIVSDYCYGVASTEVIERLQALQAAHSRVLLVDSKGLHHFRNVGATVITPNHLEARLLVEYSQPASMGGSENGQQLAEVEQIARQLLTMINTQHVAITMAENGVLLLDRQHQARHLPAHPVAKANDVGAGDSFVSAMGLALAGGASIEEAAQIGIDAAGIAVTKRWTALVQHQELLQRVSLREHIAHSTTGAAPYALTRLATQLNAERLAGKKIVFTNGVFDILHAGHVQFLRQARALGDVLVVGINSDRGARLLKGRNRPINSEQDRMALVAALDPVDYVTLFDEDIPAALIRTLRPHIHVKGGDYVDEALPEAQAVEEVGGHVVILPLANHLSTSSVIDRIIATAFDHEIGVEG